MNDEFILTNESGSYSSYNLSRGNIRKYHGILVASLPGLERINIVPTLIEKIYKNDQETDFSGNHFDSNDEANLSKYIKRSLFLPFPQQKIVIGNIEIIKRIAIDEVKHKATVLYTISTPEDITFEVEPLYSNRSYHDIGLQLNIGEILTKGSLGKLNIQLDETKNISVFSPGEFINEKRISYGHYYPEEEKRGYEAREDLVSVGKYKYKIPRGKHRLSISFAMETHFHIKRLFTLASDIINPSDNNSLISDITRFHSVYKSCNEDLAEFLVYNARKFIIKDDQRYSLIAGYHWFGEWGRDTFISFKGILLGLGKFHEAQRVLLDWSKYISIGLLPNQIQGMHFNSIDGILWYVVAIWHYWEATNDKDTIVHLLPKLERIVYALARGSKYGIFIEENGFLIWTDKKKALTWMDAIVDGEPVTQRAGAAVEVQALWYNALQIIEALAKKYNYKLVNLSLFDQLENLLEKNFEKNFWLENLGYYADFLDLDYKANTDLRPNQVAIFGLPFVLGNKKNAHIMLKKVEEDLLTKTGLRTLSPDSPDYRPHYIGNQKERDLAYHQGVVWPWLLILYYNALLNTSEKSIDAKSKICEHLDNVWSHIKNKHLISMPELFDAENNEPGGTIAQAWSTAALIEGIMITNTKKT